MYNQPEVALAMYGLSVGQITKGRGAYICETDKGLKLLMPYKASEERAVFLRDILKFIQDKGMPVEQIVETKESGVLSKDDTETKYILKDYITGTECNTQKEEELSEAFRKLAKLHVILEKYDEKMPEYMKTDKGSVLEICEKHNRELVNTKNYIRTKKKKSEFEMMFQKKYQAFSEHARQSMECCRELEKKKLPQMLCHGDCNQHNILQTDKGWQITNFEKINCNVFVSDLANFLRKIMEKNNWEINLGARLLDEYESVAGLRKEEKELLGALLLFPEKFWKITNHYNNTRKSWVSGRDIEKLMKLVEQEKNRILFLENIFSFHI